MTPEQLKKCREAFSEWYEYYYGRPFTLAPDGDFYSAESKAAYSAFKAAWQAAKSKEQPDGLAEGVLKLTATLRYIQGIVERGENRKLADDEPVDIAILNYVKKLEDTESIQQEYYKRGWKEAQEHYSVPMREIVGFKMLCDAPRDGTQILLWIEHSNYKHCMPQHKADWAGWYSGYWIAHNGGGWVHHGIAGEVKAWTDMPKRVDVITTRIEDGKA